MARYPGRGKGEALNQLSCDCASAKCGLTLEVESVKHKVDGQSLVAIRIPGVADLHERPTVWLDRSGIVTLYGILRARAAEMKEEP